MNLLAPLYIAGALAIALPILFHLIRRTPTGRQEFSSLMFLTPSPPRITRRSRIQNLLLLLLRATALIILALAFARPFLPQSANAEITEARGRRVALLVDTSASMARGDLPAQARRHAEAALDQLNPADEVALYRFDRGVTAIFGFEQWKALAPQQRLPALRTAIASLRPTRGATHTGDALAAVADVLAAGEDHEAGAIERRLVLISDMQRGGHAEALQKYEWPAGVALDVRPVATGESTNASMQLVRETEAAAVATPGAPTATATIATTTAAERLRVRVSNEPGGSREQFSLAWAGRGGAIPGTEVKTYVPPGRSQVVRLAVPDPDKQADRIVLTGDDFDFDNTLFIVPPRRESVRVVYIGDDAPDDVKGLQYYVRNAYGDTPRRTVEFSAQRAEEGPADADLLGARLVIIAGAVPDERLAALRQFVEGGGDVLWVLRDASGAQPLAKLMRLEAPEVAEAGGAGGAGAGGGDFVLITRIEFDHPLLAPFADARFSDFSRIHFWKHRRLKVDEGAGVRVLARFDHGAAGGDPFLIEQAVGQGRLFVMTAGWHPADSQLALSTKFVPLMEGFLKRRDAVSVEAQYIVHEPIALPRGSGEAGWTITGPDRQRIALPRDAATFAGADQPGIYQLVSGGEEARLAANLSPDESRTAALAAEELEQFGVRLGGARASAELTERRRQLERTELENRQKLWRWLIVGVIGLLAAETLLAGRLARRERRQAADQNGPDPQVSA